MAGNFNKVILMGNLTRDCETRFGGNGTAIVKFGLAVNRRFQDAEGNWKDQPTFVDVTMFGKRGEAFARFHTKGKPAFIEGHLRMDNWEDKQTGQKRSKLYVVADAGHALPLEHPTACADLLIDWVDAYQREKSPAAV